MTFDDLKESILSYIPSELDKIQRAYLLAEELHRGTLRQSGEPYIIHPLNVANILASLHMDGDTIAAGLLHDTIEDTDITKEEIAKYFGDDVALLVDGVTKMSKLNCSYSEKEKIDDANLRKILVGMLTDVRIIIIKLADRLHNMRTLQYKKPSKQIENARETLDMYVPLADFIGICDIRIELEDLSFKYLNADEYSRIEELRIKILEASEELLDEMLCRIHELLAVQNISSTLKYRIKNVYGIYKKIKRGRTVANIEDLMALKVIVDTVSDCYLSLGIIHKEYHPIPNGFRDYVCNPKTNQYQGLHSTVFAPINIAQVQIRTLEMHQRAAYGITALGSVDDMQNDLKQNFPFYRTLKEFDQNILDDADFGKQVRSELFLEKIYVYNERGVICELPHNSTLLDYAIYVNRFTGLCTAFVNGYQVAFDYPLHNQDRILLITNDYGYDSLSLEKCEETVQTCLAKKRIKEMEKMREA